jgi:membrane protein DedA with SNARE-associated domain
MIPSSCAHRNRARRVGYKPGVLALIKQIIEWVGPAFSGVAGYAIIGAAVLAERSILLGLIIPGDVILALGGVYAARGKLNLVAVIIIGTVSAIAGESIGFALGRRFGTRLIRRIPLVRRFGDRLDKAEEYFKKQGGMTVAVGRYATAAGAFIPFAAGTGKMPYAKFLLWDVPAIIVWATAITIVGWAFGQNLDTVEKILSRFGYVMLGLLALIIGGRWAWKRFARGRART